MAIHWECQWDSGDNDAVDICVVLHGVVYRSRTVKYKNKKGHLKPYPTIRAEVRRAIAWAKKLTRELQHDLSNSGKIQDRLQDDLVEELEGQEVPF